MRAYQFTIRRKTNSKCKETVTSDGNQRSLTFSSHQATFFVQNKNFGNLLIYQSSEYYIPLKGYLIALKIMFQTPSEKVAKIYHRKLFNNSVKLKMDLFYYKMMENKKEHLNLMLLLIKRIEQFF